MNMNSGSLQRVGDVSGSLTPTYTATYDLGTSAKKWKDLYLSGAIQGESGVTVPGGLITTGSIEAQKLIAGSITEAYIANQAITEALLSSSAVTETKIADDSVSSPKIIAGAVLAGKIAAGAVSANKLNIVDWYSSGSNWTNNSPSAGYVAWNQFVLYYSGSAYTIASGSTNNKYLYWLYSSPNALQTSGSKPTLTGQDAMVCINDSGSARPVLQATMIHGGSLLASSIYADEIGAGQVTAEKIEALAITADKIAANAITSVKITASAITADKIAAGVITTAKLSFVPLTSINSGTGSIIATINASAEGLDISAGYIAISASSTFAAGYNPATMTPTGSIISYINLSPEAIVIGASKIAISGSTTFAAGYNPTTKVTALGGSYSSSATNPRLMIFPDANTGLQAVNDVGGDVFKIVVGGATVGDVIIGNYPTSGILWDKSSGSLYVRGKLVADDIITGTLQAAVIINRTGSTTLPAYTYVAKYTGDLAVDATSLAYVDIFTPDANTEYTIKCELGLASGGTTAYCWFWFNLFANSVAISSVGAPIADWIEVGDGTVYPWKGTLVGYTASTGNLLRLLISNTSVDNRTWQYIARVYKKVGHTHTIA